MTQQPSRNLFTRTGALAANDPLFRGRCRELAQLEQACLHDHRSFMLIYGGRQTGKTILLLKRKAQSGKRKARSAKRKTDRSACTALALSTRNPYHAPTLPCCALRPLCAQTALRSDRSDRFALRSPPATRPDTARTAAGRTGHTPRPYPRRPGVCAARAAYPASVQCRAAEGVDCADGWH